MTGHTQRDTGSADRITIIDAVRGAALFGILVVNIQSFASVYYGSGFTPPGGQPPLDRSLAFGISALFELKFYLIFSFLFGYSVTLQEWSAQRAGAAFLPRMIRRQAGLFFIGLAHATLLFHADILSTYAVMGLVLLAFGKRTTRWRMRTAAGLIAATALVWLSLAILQKAAPPFDDGPRFAHNAQAALAAYRDSPYEIIGQHMRALLDFLPMLLLLQAPCALAMFLVGQIAGECRALEDAMRYRSSLARYCTIGLVVGLPGALAYATATQLQPGSALETAGLALSVLTAPFLAMAILATLVRMLEWHMLARPRIWLAATGRTALSNYILQSALCSAIFHGYGLGYIGRVSVGGALVLAVMIFAIQLWASSAWLKLFRQGALERLLRTATQWRWSVA